MDLLDIFRLRVRVGPGLAANFRITDYGAFYAGNYHSVYVGLPGPRHPHSIRSPVGLESLKGIVAAGVDITDDTPHGPEYGVAESDVGLHLLLVGAEAGVDAVEIGDFLGGLIGLDPRDDDYPRPKKTAPELSSGISFVADSGPFVVEPKPAVFTNFTARLDYMHLNVQKRVSEPVRFTDAYFAVDPQAPIAVPQTQFRLSMYVTLTQGDEFDLELSPDIEMDVELPNMEHRLRVFVETAQANALPQSAAADNDEQGVDVGARKHFDRLNLSLDAGVRATWVPEAFVRLTWREDWRLGKWTFEPEQRVFYETEDKFGSRTSIFVTRWIGKDLPFVLIEDASIKWTSDEGEAKWAASVNGMRVHTLLDERRRGMGISWDDTARAQGLQASVFGTDDLVDKYRVAIGFRGPLYKKWIYWEIDPGLEWDEEEDYDTAFFVRLGLDMLFWGHAQ